MKQKGANLSHTFLLPSVLPRFTYHHSQKVISTWTAMPGDEDITDTLHVLFEDLTEDEIQTLESYPHFKSKICVYSPDVWMYSFEIEDKEIFDSFKRGAYSKFPTRYKIKHFPKYNSITGEKSVDHQIVYRSDTLRKMWEEYLDVELPANAEVWSKPELKNESFDKEVFEQRFKACYGFDFQQNRHTIV